MWTHRLSYYFMCTSKLGRSRALLKNKESNMINCIVDASEIFIINTVLKRAMPIWDTWYMAHVPDTTDYESIRPGSKQNWESQKKSRTFWKSRFLWLQSESAHLDSARAASPGTTVIHLLSNGKKYFSSLSLRNTVNKPRRKLDMSAVFFHWSIITGILSLDVKFY